MQEGAGGGAFLKSQPQDGMWFQPVVAVKVNARCRPASPGTVGIGGTHSVGGIGSPWAQMTTTVLASSTSPGASLGLELGPCLRSTFSCWNWCCILSWALSNMPSATCRSTPLLMTSFIFSHAFLPVIWAASGKNDSHSYTTAKTCLGIFSPRKKDKHAICILYTCIPIYTHT